MTWGQIWCRRTKRALQEKSIAFFPTVLATIVPDLLPVVWSLVFLRGNLTDNVTLWRHCDVTFPRICIKFCVDMCNVFIWGYGKIRAADSTRFWVIEEKQKGGKFLPPIDLLVKFVIDTLANIAGGVFLKHRTKCSSTSTYFFDILALHDNLTHDPVIHLIGKMYIFSKNALWRS